MVIDGSDLMLHPVLRSVCAQGAEMQREPEDQASLRFSQFFLTFLVPADGPAPSRALESVGCSLTLSPAMLI